MTAFSDYLENKLLDHTLRNIAYTPPAAVYLALFTNTATAAELEAGTLTNEVVGGSYTRQTISFAASTGGGTSNSNALTFTNLPAVTLAYAAVMDATTAGNVLYFAQLATPVVITAGDGFQIAAGGFTVQLN